MSYLDENIQKLSKTQPTIAAMLSSMQSDVLIPVDTKTAAKSAEYKGMLLHSKHDPLREAERIARHTLEQFQKDGSDAIVCLGFGLAFHIEALLEQDSMVPIVIVEPEPSIISSAFALRSFDILLGSTRDANVANASRIFWHIEGDEKTLISIFEEHDIRFPHLATLQSLIQLYDPAVVENLAGTIERFRARNELNRNTLERFGERWTRNIVKNLPLINKSHGVEDIVSLFHDMPCLICAAGPTLDEDHAILEACYQRMPILAVDTALPLLEKKGIEPDVLLVMEPQYWNSRHLDRGCGKLILVSDNATYPRVFRLCKEATLVLAASLFPLGQYFDPPGRLKVGAGGSVAATAWDFARLLGIQCIYMAGLDLGFPQFRTHARGAFAERLLQKRESRLNRMEGQVMRYLYSANARWTNAMAENKNILSDERMKLYRWWFESQFTRYPDIQTQLLSTDSSALKGALLADKEKIYDLPVKREEIDRRIELVLSAPPRLSTELGDSSATECSSKYSIEYSTERKRELLITHLQELADIAEEAIQLSKKLLERPKERAKLLPKIESLERQISERSSKDIVGFLMQHSFRRIMERRDSSLAYENTLELHTALFESAKEQIAILSSKIQIPRCK